MGVLMSATKKKKVVVIGTGGTIAMKRGPDGTLVPYQSMEKMIREEPGMDEFLSKYEIETIDLMNEDSSDRDPTEWELIGKKVVEAVNREDVDGVVITHGTDTMAYTAQYLDYSIKNPRKPIVLTGSQIAASEPNSDGIPNLKDAIKVAADGPFGQVVLTFKGEIWGAENAVKYKIWEPQPFRAIGRKPVGSIKDGKIDSTWSRGYSGDDYETPFPRGMLLGSDMFCPTDAWLESYFEFDGIEEVVMRPGIKTEKLMELAKSENNKAIIVHGFGAGNIAERYHPFIEEATKRGKLVVMCSQAEGPVDLLEYGLGRKALEKGALPAGDRTPEEVYMRLAHSLGVSKGMKQALEEPAFLEFLKEKEIGLNTQEIARYMFMSDTKFKRNDDDEKYATLLRIPKSPYYDDELRHLGAMDVAYRRAMPLLVNEKLKLKSKGTYNEMSYENIASAVKEKRKSLKVDK